ncbi:MAG TPA: CDP-alcohol phosphatidyltransferase family protein [Verrucomicrobiae bacterium]|nr:CDP-alcohol phosphatidyltransferase family protein [Verrucomicrobiae bacterium]
MTTANKVTILRILLVPFFVVEVLYFVGTGDEIHRLLALISFAVASVCDGVDGYIARHYNQKSELGAILDPLADKLLLVSGVVVLSFDHTPRLDRVPLWLTGTIIGRDVVLLLGLIVIYMTVGKVTVRPRILGKVATVFQMATVLWILLRWPPAALTYIVMGAAACTGISGIWYVLDGMKQLGAHPTSSPTVKKSAAPPNGEA